MVHSFPDMVYMAKTMKECGVKPELECYDIGMINNARVLGDMGHIRNPALFSICSWGPRTDPRQLDNLIHMVRAFLRGAPGLSAPWV